MVDALDELQRRQTVAHRCDRRDALAPLRLVVVRFIVPCGVLILMLILRPQGLFGTKI